MNKKLKIGLSSLLLAFVVLDTPVKAAILDYSIIHEKEVYITRNVSTTEISDSYYYTDGTFSGYIERVTEPKLTSGVDSAYKEVTATSSWSESWPSSTYYYSSGGYSGYLDRYDYDSEGRTRTFTGSASISVDNYYIHVGNAYIVKNDSYTDEGFKYSDTDTWYGWEAGTNWSGPFTDYYPNGASGGFSVSTSGGSVTSATYNGKPASVSKGSDSYSYRNLYKSNPNNGYSAPINGQRSGGYGATLRWDLSAQEPYTVYKGFYSGIVSTPDTRKWDVSYSGKIYYKEVRTYDSTLTAVIPNYLEENKSIDIKVTAKNTGTLPWRKEDLIKLQNLGDIKISESNKFEIDEGIEVKTGQTYTWTISLPPLQEGKYNFEFNMLKDNGDGVFGDALSHTLNVYSLKPFNDKLEILNYDYKNGENYYIKNNSDVDIYVDGYLGNYTNKYPTHNYVKFESTDKEILEQKTDLIGTILDDKLTKNTFTLSGNSKLTKYVTDNKNYVKNTQKYIVKGEDNTYKLYNKTEYQADTLMKYGDYVDSNKFLHIDGTAPAVNNAKEDIEIYSDGYFVYTKIKNLIEEGSGVKEVYVEYSSKNKSVKQQLDINSRAYEAVKKITELNFDASIEKINVKVTAIDNVGNMNIIFDNEIYIIPIEIEGVIMPNPAPAGKLISLKTKTSGSATKIRVKFPDEIVSLGEPEDNLSIEKEVNVEHIHYEDIRVRIPLYTPGTLSGQGERIREPYKIYIEAENKYGDTANAWLTLDIQNDILTGVKVRIRATGYDKE